MLHVYGEQSFLKVNWKIKPLHLYFSLFCSHLYGRKKTEDFCGRDEAKKKIIVGKPIVKNASNSEIFQSVGKESSSNVSGLGTI